MAAGPGRVEAAQARTQQAREDQKRQGQRRTLLAGETGGYSNPATGPRSLLG
jgi:hypothetical protein